MGFLRLYMMLCVTWSLFTLGSFLLQSSQLQVLLQVRKHLEYPTQLEIWTYKDTDLCYSSPTTRMNVTCSGNVVVELRIWGDKPSKNGDFVGYSIPNQTLSESFSMDSFVTTLARLGNLRVLSLVSLGIWGSLPEKIHRLTTLEYLDLSSNYLYGSIPPQIGGLVGLKTLELDGNFFNDSMPDWLESLSNLMTLSLVNNQLKGRVPSSIGGMRSLVSLSLSNNEISGQIPDLSGLSSLTLLDLTGNRLDSKLPDLPNGLVVALFSKNSFDGEIPKGYSQLSQLQNLDLSSNNLKGKLLAAIFSLPNISSVNLASNTLSGSLPYNMECGEKLSFVDISNNQLTGGLPGCLSKKVAKFAGNCLTVDVSHQHPGSYCIGSGYMKSEKSKSGGLLVSIGVIGGTMLILALLVFGFVMIFRQYCPGGSSEQHLLNKQVHENPVTGVTPELMANARFISQAVKSATQGIPTCRVFSIEELNEATNNFDQSVLIGESSRGKVYKGKLQNGTPVAIRCLALSSKYTIRNFKLRLDLLAKLRHPHLVCLLGHCIDNNGAADLNKAYLIYEYMDNGNLGTHLSDNDPARVFKWTERLAILIDIARAVHFLHTGIIPGFFNNRLKLHNILLDGHRKAKLSDYGLSIVSDDDDKPQRERGNDLSSWQMRTLEDDMYGFGFIIWESIVGPSGPEMKNAVPLNEMGSSLGGQDSRRRIVAPVVLNTSTQESLRIVMSIAEKCVSPDSSTRPSIEDVLWNLQYAAQVQATADGDAPKSGSPPHSRI
ncbi:hypothetical protein Drorol1_Dr00021424 [Drosera rotundifolia]